MESGEPWCLASLGPTRLYLLLLLPLLAGFLLGPPLQELFGKFFGFQRVPQAGTDIIMDIIGGLHLLEDRYSHGHYGEGQSNMLDRSRVPSANMTHKDCLPTIQAACGAQGV